MLSLSVADCKRVLDVPSVLEATEQALLWEANGDVIYSQPNQLRMTAKSPAVKCHSKAVILPKSGVAGFRIVGYSMEGPDSGPSSEQSTRLVVLMDLESGAPIALIDEHYNYTLRTAASVAIAAKRLYPEQPVLGLIGVGGVARSVAPIFSHVLPLEAVYVTSRRPERRSAFVREHAPQLGVAMHECDSVEDVIERSNVLVTATTTTSPLVAAGSVRPGMLICALGSFELEEHIYLDADKFIVDSWDQTSSAHDMREPVERGTITREHVYSELAAIVAGEVPGRESGDEVIVVRTEGLAAQDVALAHLCYVAAQEQGLGAEL